MSTNRQYRRWLRHKDQGLMMWAARESDFQDAVKVEQARELYHMKREQAGKCPFREGQWIEAYPKKQVCPSLVLRIQLLDPSQGYGRFVWHMTAVMGWAVPAADGTYREVDQYYHTSEKPHQGWAWFDCSSTVGEPQAYRPLGRKPSKKEIASWQDKYGVEKRRVEKQPKKPPAKRGRQVVVKVEAAAEWDFIDTFPKLRHEIAEDADALTRLCVDFDQDVNAPEFLKMQHFAWLEELAARDLQAQRVMEAIRQEKNPETGRKWTTKQRDAMSREFAALSRQTQEQLDWYEDYFGEAARRAFQLHLCLLTSPSPTQREESRRAWQAIQHFNRPAAEKVKELEHV